MKEKLVNKIFIYAFLFLYALVAFISFCHAIEFFDIGNVHWMSIMLAFAFELGLAVCLASILIGTNKRNSIAWVLLTILVIVQVIGNTYSVFKFISESGVDYYNYLAKPMLFMIEEVSQETVQIIISWIMGAILPIVALLMTEMVANGIRENQNVKVDEPEETPQVEEKINEPKPVYDIQPVKGEVENESEDIENEKQEVSEGTVSPIDYVDKKIDPVVDEPTNEPTNELINEPINQVNDEPIHEQNEPVFEPNEIITEEITEPVITKVEPEKKRYGGMSLIDPMKPKVIEGDLGGIKESIERK
jgi:hypothetical protein